MFNLAIKFNHYPAIVKWALLFLVLGWALHLGFYFKFMEGQISERNAYLMVGIGIAICYFTAAINRWARAMCLFFNLGIIVLYLVLTLAFVNSGKMAQAGFTSLVVAAFIAASVLLFLPKTRDFFKSFNPVEDSSTQV
jgi:hypothetical protein